MRRVLGMLAATVVALGATLAQAAETRLGVIAPRGEAAATAQWGEFARYLETSIGQPVKLVPVVLAKLEQAIANGEVDYALVNPVQGVSVKERLGTPILASLVLPTGNQFGGVIVANPKSGIAKGADLKGKKVIGLSKSAAGAFLFQAYELKKAGVRVPEDVAVYQEAKKQDDVVLAVKAGVMDAGFVRTGVLEDMIQEGKLKPDDVVIVDKKPTFPQGLSTALYPEWYLIAVNKADGAVAGKVKAAALALKADSEAAKVAEIKGFSEPLDPGATVQMMKDMKVPPFDK